MICVSPHLMFCGAYLLTANNHIFVDSDVYGLINTTVYVNFTSFEAWFSKGGARGQNSIPK